MAKLRGCGWLGATIRTAFTTGEGLKALLCWTLVGSANLLFIGILWLIWLAPLLVPPERRKSWQPESWGGSTDPSGRPVWGEGGKGLLIFLENGRYSSQLMRADLPKFGSGSRLQGSPEENKAVVQGSVSRFGAYTVDEGKKAFTIKWEAHTFPKLTGQSQTRSFAITGDELRIQNPGPTAGGPPSELVYRRDK
jgi:hypothetical protein